MLKDRLLETDWFDDDLYDKVLQFNYLAKEQAEQASEHNVRFYEDPKIQEIIHLMEKAKLQRKKTGIHQVDEEQNSAFWKKTIKTNGKEHQIDIGLISEMLEKPEVHIVEKQHPFTAYKSGKLLPVTLKAPFQPKFVEIDGVK